VLCGIVEALGLRASDASPFDILAGSSVGAIHAAFLAAHAHRGDLSLGRFGPVLEFRAGRGFRDTL
jgi:predicted acylesterase/phospholipase RssA